jgi:hypothetical protein
MGPKPTVDILVKYNGEPIKDPVFTAKMLTCYNSSYQFSQDCLKYGSYWFPASLAWGGNCTNSECHFGYMPPTYFKLQVDIPSLGRSFTTNYVNRTNFYSKYEANLNPDGTATIKETTSVLETANFLSFIVAFILTLIIELFFGAVYISIEKIKGMKLLLWILITNSISVPIVWLVFPLFTSNLFSAILIGEVFAVFFEAYLYFYFSRKNFPSYTKAIELSIILNGTSFFFGGFIFLFFTLFLIPVSLF